ncbi:hypothetical protein SAMN05216509_5311 [Pseudomonas sp. B10]|jgi:hypothetical protein|uniref:hypothetical protein n=1 Tax=Pseudomonas sp. B10 TaxID=118613 RepID=UPI0009537662|nr:hypothetical protein [Pseudomonas sp. B10]SIR83815.1 hypothetical protein SAMN05216509_5311 [Pseudomonas sp. B10]
MSNWIPIGELPEREIGARYLMILDGSPQACQEIEMEGTSKRWFYGEENGAYPIDEIELFKPISTE